MLTKANKYKAAILHSSVQFNLFGLRAGHASLYKYLEKCSKEGKPIEAKEVALIFWKEVKNPEALWDERNHHFRVKNIPTDPIVGLKNKDVYEFFSTNNQWKRSFNNACMIPAKNWLKGAIGSLVMRGVLQVIPKLDTELLEK